MLGRHVFFIIALALVSGAPTTVAQCWQAFNYDIAKAVARYPHTLILNTSNPEKQSDFQNIFSSLDRDIIFRDTDLAEIKAEALLVIAHKASYFKNPDEMVLVEDTSLDVDGVDIGINVRWLQASLKDHIGKRAVWRSLIGVRLYNQVLVFEGVVKGRIGPASGEGIGFDPVFIPDGSDKTLGQYKPAHFNARAIAAENFAKLKPLAILPALEELQGPWQEPKH